MNPITTPLTYLQRNPKYTKEKPYICLLDPATTPYTERTNIVTEKINVPVTDVRHADIELSLDTSGFERVVFDDGFRAEDFKHEGWIKDVYHPFLCDFLKKRTGAVEAVVYDHVVRRQLADENEESDKEKPVSLVHADQTPTTAQSLFQHHWPNYIDDLLSSRIQIINVWRPLVKTVTQWPLALCDNRTVHPTDLQAFDVIKEDYVGESYVAYYSERHKWYYVSEQGFGEGWMMRLFDSKEGVNGVLHTAVDIGRGGELRSSCEVRVFLRY